MNIYIFLAIVCSFVSGFFFAKGTIFNRKKKDSRMKITLRITHDEILNFNPSIVSPNSFEVQWVCFIVGKLKNTGFVFDRNIYHEIDPIKKDFIFTQYLDQTPVKDRYKRRLFGDNY